MKEKKIELEKAGWVCSKCACPSGQGFDCAHKDHRGYMVMLRPQLVKLMKSGYVIDSKHIYQIKEMFAKYELPIGANKSNN
jgi:hypothetical protein